MSKSARSKAAPKAKTDTAVQRATKNSTVQFRLDDDKMELLQKVADERATGTGVLARMWVIERLDRETGNVQFDPMLAMAESMRALAHSVGANNWSSELNKRIDLLEQQIENKTGVTLPRTAAISHEISNKLDQLDEQFKQKTGISIKAGELPAEIQKRLDELEAKLKEKTGVTIPRPAEIQSEVLKRIDQLELQIKEKTGVVLPTPGEISQEVHKRLDQLEAQIKQKTGITFGSKNGKTKHALVKVGGAVSKSKAQKNGSSSTGSHKKKKSQAD